MDRDGVINKLPPKYPNDGIGDIRNYITKWEDFEFLDGAKEAVKMVLTAGFVPIVISNQGGAIGRKLVEYKTIDDIFKKMELMMLAGRAHYTPFYYFCPHLISDNCACIKPKPGMLYQAAIEHNIDLAQSWMIGDSGTDLEAGYNAGIRKCIGVGSRFYSFPGGGVNHSVPSLLEAVKYILST